MTFNESTLAMIELLVARQVNAMVQVATSPSKFNIQTGLQNAGKAKTDLRNLLQSLVENSE